MAHDDSLWSAGSQAETAWCKALLEESCSHPGDQEAENDGRAWGRRGPKSRAFRQYSLLVNSYETFQENEEITVFLVQGLPQYVRE